MRLYRQWVLWRLEAREGAKHTKVPYQPSGHKADVTKPETWCSYDEAIAACPNPDYATPSPQGYSGIGFVLTKSDPYGFIDLDDCHDDAASYERQVKIYREFDSYAEKSPSGTGLHIILKGKVPQGRRRSNIEVYSDNRYMTMTGDVYNDREIIDRHDLLNLLWNEMGAAPTLYTYGQDQPEKQTDEDIYKSACAALNGEKFSQLYEGRWDLYYPSQSEADYALIDILAFYTQNRNQIARMFRLSALGDRAKAKRANYVNYMIDKSFDRQLPPIDIDGLRIKGDLLLKQTNPEVAQAPGLAGSPLLSAPSTPSGAPVQSEAIFPPGLVGEIAQFLLAAAPRPVPLIALAGAIGFFGGIAGRAYNISGSGLNQYILCIAETGTGKDAIASGVSRLVSMIKPSVPAAVEFVGPGEIASFQGITKWLSKYPSVVSIIGEFGMKLKEMSSERANPHTAGIMRLLLQLYTKSGKGQTVDPTAYSDLGKNTHTLFSPAFSLIGESTPTRFYEVLDEKMIADGLLPRFTIFEYFGKSPYVSKSHKDARPSFSLVEGLSAVMAQCLASQQSQNICEVSMSPEAEKLLDDFDRYSTDKRNNTSSEVTRQLWNRAHLKVLKISALIAVGINYLNPIVTVNEVNYAANIIVDEIQNLIAHFESGDTGTATNNGLNEPKQLKDLRHVLKQWFNPNTDTHTKYKMTDEMKRDYVFPWATIQTRMFNQLSFKNDRYGPSAALKKAIQSLIDAGDIAELSKQQAKERYGTAGKLYCIVNLAKFQ